MDTNERIDRFLSSFALWAVVIASWVVAILK
jgi:hypothetical protein